jgi:hypothetical protein
VVVVGLMEDEAVVSTVDEAVGSMVDEVVVLTVDVVGSEVLVVSMVGEDRLLPSWAEERQWDVEAIMDRLQDNMAHRDELATDCEDHIARRSKVAVDEVRAAHLRCECCGRLGRYTVTLHYLKVM